MALTNDNFRMNDNVSNMVNTEAFIYLASMGMKIPVELSMIHSSRKRKGCEYFAH